MKIKHELAPYGERKVGTPTMPIEVLTLEHINEAEVAKMNAKPHKLDPLFRSKACVL